MCAFVKDAMAIECSAACDICCNINATIDGKSLRGGRVIFERENCVKKFAFLVFFYVKFQRIFAVSFFAGAGFFNERYAFIYVIEIDVTKLWYNRVVGDGINFPLKIGTTQKWVLEGKAKVADNSRYTYTLSKVWDKNFKFDESGLIKLVKILSVKIVIAK